MSAFFSVIIPTYNRPQELKRAVESVLSQTFKDFELIVVNNGSDALILPSDERVKILTEKRRGGNYARNTGIENAQSQFVCFLDDDDIYLNTHLETLHALIQKHNGKVALYRTFTRIETAKGVFADQPLVLKGEGETVLDHLFTVLLFLGCVCCHRDILKEIKFDPSVPVAQDYHFLARILAVYPLIEVPVVTTVYHKTDNSVSSPGLNTYLNYIKVHQALFNIEGIKSNLSGNIQRKRLFRYYDLLLSSHYKELSVGRFLKFSLEADRYNAFYFFSVHYLKLLGKFLFSK